ncbi:hypothetical protein ACQ4PT_029552 [Festuca glaucescens]
MARRHELARRLESLAAREVELVAAFCEGEQCASLAELSAAQERRRRGVPRQRGTPSRASLHLDALWRGPLLVGTDTTLLVAPDAGPDTSSASKGVLVLGATAWVENYNVPVRTADVDAVRRITRRVRQRGGGLWSVQAMGLEHGDGGAEVACNLLAPQSVSAGQVQDMVERLAREQGFDAGEGYFTDFSEGCAFSLGVGGSVTPTSPAGP